MAFGQTSKVYFDRLEKKCVQDSASFYRNYTLQPDGRYKVEQRTFPGDTLVLTGFYRTMDSESKAGYFICYKKDGFVSMEGNYRDNLRVGEWKYYYDSARLQATIQYRKGLTDGELTTYYKSGKRKRVEIDSCGQTTAGACFDEEGNAIKFTPYEIQPEPTFSMPLFLQHNLVYPVKAREAGIMGRVIVQFVITPTGQITDVKVVKSVNKWLDAEAVRCLSTMPPWRPGTQDDVPVPVYFTQPISFILD